MRTQGAQAHNPVFLTSLFIEGRFQGLGFINLFLFSNKDFLTWHEFQRVCPRKRLTVRKKAHAWSHVYSFGNDMLVYFFKLIALPLSSLISRTKGVTVKLLRGDPLRHLTHAEMDRQNCHLLDCGWEIVQVVTLSTHWLFTRTRKNSTSLSQFWKS